MLENRNMIDLLRSLKEMSSEQLTRLIQEETSKESPNDDLVMMVLDILEDREKEEPVQLGPKETAAWKKYQSKVCARQRKSILILKPIMQVASVLVAIILLFALLPTQANAETWWERLARWTDDFFSFFNPNESEIPENEDVFQTNNEGLQEVYDMAIEMGVVSPLIPMWLPENYELIDVLIDDLENHVILVSAFSNGTDEIVFCIRLLLNEIPMQYFKTNSEVTIYENHGVSYNIIENNETKTVTWTKDNVEYFISIDCQKDTLYEIIDSIYRWRINK